MFEKKGFRVWPSSWKSEANTRALREYAKAHDGDNMFGHLFTTWGSIKVDQLATWPPITAVLGGATTQPGT
jgi:hypothetical protein